MKEGRRYPKPYNPNRKELDFSIKDLRDDSYMMTPGMRFDSGPEEFDAELDHYFEFHYNGSESLHGRDIEPVLESRYDEQ
jgi:hypothetical protein